MTKTNDCSAELARLKERLLEAEAHLLSLLSLVPQLPRGEVSKLGEKEAKERRDQLKRARLAHEEVNKAQLAIRRCGNRERQARWQNRKSTMVTPGTPSRLPSSSDASSMMITPTCP